MYLLGCIRDYDRVKEAVPAEGGDMITAALASSSNRKRRTTEEDEDFSVVPIGFIERFMYNWGKWPATHLEKLVRYLEPSLAEVESSMWRSRVQCGELVEFALDLRLVGAVQDKVYTIDMKDLCEGAKVAYDAKGRRLAALVDAIKGGEVSAGFYQARKVEQENQLPKLFVKSTQFPDEVAACVIRYPIPHQLLLTYPIPNQVDPIYSTRLSCIRLSSFMY
jgi:hypothetical protein